MNDLIDRQAVFAMLDDIEAEVEDGDGYQYKKWREYIEQLPSAQPQRMRGRWVEVTDCISIWKVCNQCGEKPLWNEWRTDRYESNYCPNCGADMREEQDG